MSGDFGSVHEPTEYFDSSCKHSRTYTEEDKGEHNVFAPDKDFEDLRLCVEEDISMWKRICENNDVTVYKRKEKNDSSPMILIKSLGTLRGIPMDIAVEALANTESRKSWDKLFSHFELVEEDKLNNEAVLYYVIKAPIGITNRDFL